jgi:hypothetical protein
MWTFALHPTEHRRIQSGSPARSLTARLGDAAGDPSLHLSLKRFWGCRFSWRWCLLARLLYYVNSEICAALRACWLESSPAMMWHDESWHGNVWQKYWKDVIWNQVFVFNNSDRCWSGRKKCWWLYFGALYRLSLSFLELLISAKHALLIKIRFFFFFFFIKSTILAISIFLKTLNCTNTEI